jgi:21S rRNA (GM2251-2'-O)-methyltransferase
MTNLVLARSVRELRISFVSLHRCYHVGRAGSVNTAIARGLRKSRGMGFRGKVKVDDQDPREKYRLRNGIPEYKSPPPKRVRPEMVRERRGERSKPTGFHIRRQGEYAGKQEFSAKRVARDSKYADLRERLSVDVDQEGGGRRRHEKEENFERLGRPSKGPYNTRPYRRSADIESYDRTSQPVESYPSLSFGKSSKSKSRRSVSDNRRSSMKTSSEFYESRIPERSSKFDNRRSSRKGSSESYRSRAPERSSKFDDRRSFGNLSSESHGSRASDRSSTFNGRRDPSEYKASSEEAIARFVNGSPEKSGNYSDKSSASGNSSGRDDKHTDYAPPTGPRFTQVVDNRIPLSIPYTTPASEFLYGTSVVEAALSSRRMPRRKLYKLYIYTGENREDVERDVAIEKLAKKNGVDVMKVNMDWLRLLDKMSGGRPHNGYILEASPLPKLPVTSLGQLTSNDGLDGFEVSLDYQSREEAAVNGTSNFIPTRRKLSGRKPLVLLLDSIVDPGNLGGIIRTASFLGVTAVAISSRNSAPFSPVVLKASAGASENMTLFTVNKPAGFVVDSKAAGWKVFAAVAPSKKNDPAMPASMSTDDLADPLSEDPCILMLGSEGEGLRWNLRSKADVDLYIQGSGHNHNVDSLNVSVAMGILCNSFLRSSRTKQPTPPIDQDGKEDLVLQARVQQPKGDLF